MSDRAERLFNFVDFSFYVFAGLFLLVSLFGYLTYNSMLRRYVVFPRSGDPIASISAKSGRTLFRPQAEQAWLPIRVNEDIYSGDYILTEKNSNLTLELGQESLVIPQDSRVQVFYNNSKFELLIHSTKEPEFAKKAPPPPRARLDEAQEKDIEQQKPSPTEKQATPPPAQASTPADANKPATPEPDKPSTNTAADLELSPPANSYVLISTNSLIHVNTNKVCKGSCSIKVTVEKKVVCAHDFAAGKLIDCSFDATPNLLTVFSPAVVDYSDGAEVKTYLFQFARLNPAIMQALKDPSAKVLIQ